MTVKKNFGLPVNTLCAAAFILGYGAYVSAGNWFYFLAIAGVAFAFDFDAKVKASFKQAGFLAAAGWAIGTVIDLVVNVFVSVFEIDVLGTFYSLLNKINTIYGIVASAAFVALAVVAILGKNVSVKALDELSSDSIKYPKCGAPAAEGTPFCGKCGTKL